MVTQERLKELFDYQDGQLIWKVKKARANKGDVAGCETTKRGIKYIQMKVDGVGITGHRAVYLYHHGSLPEQVDHIDGNGLNNKIENLRSATAHTNSLNQRLRNTNTSGSKNVYWHTKANRWFVRIALKGKTKSFGMYDDLELADLVAQEARNKYCGQFARHS